MTFPSFETVIRRRSGEDVRWLIGDQKRGVAGIKGDQQAECRRVTSPSACNYAGKIQGQGRQKKIQKQYEELRVISCPNFLLEQLALGAFQ